MRNEQIQILSTSFTRLLRRGATRQLLKIIDKTHMADISIVFKELSSQNRKKLFELINDPEDIGLLFSEMEEGLYLEFVNYLEFEKLVEVFDQLPSDDAAELLGLLEEDLSDQILAKMQKEESDNVEKLMSYGDDTAGSLMVTDFVAMEEDVNAKQVIEALQSEYMDVEMPFYIYVVDAYGKLVGVSSLRQLVVVHPDKPLKDFMATDMVSVNTYTDREEVARLVSRYDYLAVPVVDDENRIVGIVTVDDVIDILHEVAEEDMLKMAGVGEEYVESQTIFRGARIRLPWLFASCLGGLGAFYLIGGYEEILAQVASLAAFLPVVMGMGGNVGTQSSTIVVRGISTGRINYNDFATVIFKELSVGLLLGLIYGMVIGFVAQFSSLGGPFSPWLSVTVGLSVLTSMAVAALVGSSVPLIFERLSIDPAVATGPFVTSSIDIIGVFCYLHIARLLLGI